MLASIVEELVDAFNWRLKHGQRKNGKHIHRTLENPWPEFDPKVAPSWTASVPAIQEKRFVQVTFAHGPKMVD